MQCHLLPKVAAAILVWLLVQSLDVRTNAELTVDILLKTITVTHQDCVSRACNLIGEWKIPELTSRSQTVNVSLPEDRTHPFWIYVAHLGEALPVLTFTCDEGVTTRSILKGINLHSSLRLANGDVYHSLSNHITPLLKLLGPAPMTERAAWYEVLLKANGFELLVLLRMYCNTGYYGAICETSCEIPPGFKRERVMCDGQNFYCRPGWTGLNCELRDVCSTEGLTPCQNGATCIPTYMVGLGPGDTSTFRCKCLPGWKGPLCSIPELKFCRYPNNTFGIYSPWKYPWAADQRDTIINHVTDGKQLDEMYIFWHRPISEKSKQPAERQSRPYMSWDPNEVQPNQLRGIWRISIPQTDVENNKDTKVLRQARGMWRKREEVTTPDETPAVKPQRVAWRFVTKLEPMEPVQATLEGIVQCPNDVDTNNVAPITEHMDKRTDLTEIRRPNWIENCYQMPCLLLKGHHQRVKIEDVHVAWRNALIAAFPMLRNLKPQVTMSWIVLRDRTRVTSVNLDCNVGSLQLGVKALLKAMEYLKVDLADIRYEKPKGTSKSSPILQRAQPRST